MDLFLGLLQPEDAISLSRQTSESCIKRIEISEHSSYRLSNVDVVESSGTCLLRFRRGSVARDVVFSSRCRLLSIAGVGSIVSIHLRCPLFRPRPFRFRLLIV